MEFFPKRGFSKHILKEKQQPGLGQWVLNPSLGSLGVPIYKIAKVSSHSTAGASSRSLPSSIPVTPALQPKGTESLSPRVTMRIYIHCSLHQLCTAWLGVW